MTPIGTLNAKIRAGLAAGLSYGDIAAQTGWSRSAIFRRAKRLGESSSNPGGGPKVELPQADLATIREGLEAGESLVAIGRRIGCSKTTVAKVLAERGIRVEPTQEWLETMFGRGLRSLDLALRTGLPVEEIIERRRIWTGCRQSEIRQAQEAAKLVVPEPAAEPDGDKLSRALRAHYRPLTSLPERVAALGRRVSIRRAA